MRVRKAERKFGLVIAFSVTGWYDGCISNEDSGCRNLHESREWVKGKQVKNLRDLVTVSKEHRIGIVPLVFLEDWEGDRMCGDTSQETCQLLVQEQDAAGAVCLARTCQTAAQEAADSRPRGLGCAVIFSGVFCFLWE